MIERNHLMGSCCKQIICSCCILALFLLIVACGSDIPTENTHATITNQEESEAASLNSPSEFLQEEAASPASTSLSAEDAVSGFDYQIGDSMEALFQALREQNNKIFCGRPYAVALFKNGGGYVVAGAFCGGDEITGYAVFSEDHTLMEVHGFVRMIEIEDPSSLIGMTYEEVEERYGQYHIDAGSGRFIPCYITSAGEILRLWLWEEIYQIDVFDHSSEPTVISGNP